MESEMDTFQVAELLDYPEAHFIKKIFNTEEIDFELYRKFVEQFQLSKIQDRPLLVMVRCVKARFGRK